MSDPLVATEAFLGGIDDWILWSGRAIQNWDKSYWFRVVNREEDGDPDDVLQTIQGLPVYSARLRHSLERAGVDGFQYLPVNVFHYDGSLVSGFAVGNILNAVPALDLERSRYSRYGDDRPDHKGQIRGVRTAVLKREAVQGLDILRLQEFPIFICVSERFKEAFEAGGLTGCTQTT